MTSRVTWKAGYWFCPSSTSVTIIKDQRKKKNSFEFAQMSFGNKGVEEECLLACAKKRAQFTAKLNSGVVDLNEKKKSQISFHL